ncbi:putative (+)-germacrene D synthase [Rosa chinensis]|uniref:Putative (+)-germacrene D synthase n=1 Tax=Rosa chinensis TaxID=74649 RepID=A0A2P6PRW9_ROSCH|nr:putative (+)-germacrene D synthase [Rosa chinensis]
MNQLPEILQLCYKALIEFFEEIEDEMAKEGRSYRVHYAKETMKALCRGYLKEAQCFNQDYIPSVEEHMELALVTCTYPMLLTLALVGMGGNVTKETFEWMSQGPKILTASATISRCMDDIVGHKVTKIIVN